MKDFYVLLLSLFVAFPSIAQAQVAKPGLEKIIGGVSLRQLQQQAVVRKSISQSLRNVAPGVSAHQISSRHTRATPSVAVMLKRQRAVKGGEIAFTLPQASNTVLNAVKIQYPLYAIEENVFFDQDSYVIEMPDGDFRLFTEQDPIPVAVHTAIEQAQQRPIQELIAAVGGLSVADIHQNKVEIVRNNQLPRNTRGYQSVALLAQRYAFNSVRITLPQADGTVLKVTEVPLDAFAINENVFMPKGSYIVTMPDGDYRIFTESAPMAPATRQALQQARQTEEEQLAQLAEQRAATAQKLKASGFSEDEIRTMMKNWDEAHPSR